jgi:hypothetical protein
MSILNIVYYNVIILKLFSQIFNFFNIFLTNNNNTFEDRKINKYIGKLT